MEASDYTRSLSSFNTHQLSTTNYILLTTGGFKACTIHVTDNCHIPTWTFFPVQCQKAQLVQSGKYRVTFMPSLLSFFSSAYLNTIIQTWGAPQELSNETHWTCGVVLPSTYSSYNPSITKDVGRGQRAWAVHYCFVLNWCTLFTLVRCASNVAWMVATVVSCSLTLKVPCRTRLWERLEEPLEASSPSGASLVLLPLRLDDTLGLLSLDGWGRKVQKRFAPIICFKSDNFK